MGLRVLTDDVARNQADIDAICQDSGVNLKDCYQCGKCSAGCPIASEADMTPRQIIRNLQLGLVEPVLKAKMPWYCVECGVCLVRCPQQVDLPALNEAICRLAMRKRSVSVREGERFMNIFLDNIQRKGVSDEAMLAGRFNMETGHFMQDVLNVPTMMRNGLLSFTERDHVVEGAQEVKRIVRACREAESQAGLEVRVQQRQEVVRERLETAQARAQVRKELRDRVAEPAVERAEQAKTDVTGGGSDEAC